VNQDRAGAKRGCRPQDGTQIVRICDLIEDDHAPRRRGAVDRIVNVELFELLRQEGEALVDRFAGDGAADCGGVRCLD
jgi:hypothetical protein